MSASVLVASDFRFGDRFGYAVDLSEDGLTAIVGGYLDDIGTKTDQGSARVFDWNGLAWVQRGDPLTPTDGRATDHFGEAVAISADGRTAIIGGGQNDVTVRDQGSARVFDWNGSAWVQRGGPLIASDADVGDHFGEAVAMSPDGNTVVIGAADDSGRSAQRGSARVFDWNGTEWVQRGPIIYPSGAFGGEEIGASVTMSSDGNLIVLGAPGKYSSSGSADVGVLYAYAWNGSAWIIQGSYIPALIGGEDARFGSAVAMTPDGRTILAGAPGQMVDNKAGHGSVQVLDWNGSAWIPRGYPPLVADGEAGDGFGGAVSISANGMTILVGASGDDVNGKANQGSARVFDWNGGAWIERGFLTPANGTAGAGFGTSVALSANGRSAVVGGPLDNSARVFSWDGMQWIEGVAADAATAPPVVAYAGPGAGPTDGNDSLHGTGAGDELRGGLGDDRYLINDSDDRIIENPGEGNDSAYVTVNGWVVSAHVEAAYLREGANSLQGSDGNDILVSNRLISSHLQGHGGDDTLWGIGMGGTELLEGGDGDDLMISSAAAVATMVGGAGDDRYVVNKADAVIVEQPEEGNDTAWVTVSGWTSGHHIETVYLTGLATSVTGSDGNDVLVANRSYASNLNGGEGDDTLWGMSVSGEQLNGGAGNDTLHSGIFRSTLAGGIGDDVYILNGALAEIVERPGEGYDTAWLNAYTTQVHGNVELAYLIGSAKVAYLSGEGDIEVVSNSLGAEITSFKQATTTFWGQGGTDVFKGGAGSNVFQSGSGVTTMTGGASADIYIIRNALSSATDVEGGQGIDRAWATVDGWTVGDHIEEAYLTETATLLCGGQTAVALVANALLASTLIAGGARTDMYGSDYADAFVIGTEGGTIRGGGGGDTIRLGSLADRATVLDFNAAEGDRVDFSSLGIGRDAVQVLVEGSDTLVSYGTGGLLLQGLTAPPPDTAFVF
ncbi:WD40 repeat domain-containing protein [Rhodovarius crocodyli]|uniref:WD40 repeat domain-containing protein n=1 Tax=Rhodovarius crocodyli TaxID=1979269 RepID=UPI0013E372E6|nr:hypothetical protein [Rhodovarius crocodyli]